MPHTMARRNRVTSRRGGAREVANQEQVTNLLKLVISTLADKRAGKPKHKQTTRATGNNRTCARLASRHQGALSH